MRIEKRLKKFIIVFGVLACMSFIGLIVATVYVYCEEIKSMLVALQKNPVQLLSTLLILFMTLFFISLMASIVSGYNNTAPNQPKSEDTEDER